MMISELIFSAILNLMSIYAGFKILNLFIEKRENTLVPPLIVYTIVWAIHLGLSVSFHDINVNSISLFILFLTSAFILYIGSPARRIVSVFSVMAIGIMAENIIWSVVDAFKPAYGEELGSVIFIFFYLFLVFILEKVMMFHKNIVISMKSYLYILVILTGSVFVAEILIILNDNNYDLLLIGLSILCLIVISTFFLHDKVAEVYIEKIEKKTMENKVFMYENQIELMIQSQKKIQSLRHDMKNHLLLLQSYLDMKEYEKAHDYIEEMSTISMETKQYLNSGNIEIDAILNYMLTKAKKMSCNIDLNVTVPDISFMAKSDLNILLSNLLDNALEALEKVSDRYLYICIKYHRGVVIVQIYNSYDGIIHKKQSRYMTRKQDTHNHGLGLKNVMEIVKKYNGEQKIETTDSLFKVELLLYMDEDKK